MKIFYATNINNKHPYTQSIKKCFCDLGHEVITFENTDISRYIGAQDEQIKQLNDDFVRECEAAQPDMLFMFKGEKITYASLAKIKKTIRPIMATWWVDDPFCTLSADFNMRPYENVLDSLLLWDYFFIYETFSLTRLKRLGVNAHYLPNATDTDFFFPEKDIISASYKSDISFIGTPFRERAKMVKVLKDNNPKADITLWGGNWQDVYFKNLVKKNRVSLEEVRQIYVCSQINLNSHFYNGTTGANVRTFDIPACRGFMLTDAMSDIINNLFVEGEEVITYKNYKDLSDKVSYFMENKDERDEIIDNAYNATINKHLYKYRIAEIMSTIGAGNG